VTSDTAPPDTGRAPEPQPTRGRHRRVKRIWFAILSFIVAMTPATAAHAASSDGDAGQRFLGSVFLPITRWYTATSGLHSNTSGNWLAVGVETVMRLGQTAGLSIATFCWYVAQSFADFAATFNPLGGSLGRDVDGLIHTLGTIVTGGNSKAGPIILLMIVLIALGAAAHAAWKSQDIRLFAKRFLAIGLIVGLFTVLVAQSGSGRYNKSTETYAAAAGSPVWFGQETMRIVNLAVSGIPGAISSAPGAGAIGDDVSNLSCNAMLKGMEARLANSKASKGNDQSRRAAANTINQMYLRSVVSSYAIAQYGTNKYAQYAWCRGADANANGFGVTSTEFTAYAGWKATQGDTSGKAGFLPGTAKSTDGKYSNSTPFGSTMTKNENWAGNVIAWAACHPTVDRSGRSVSYSIDKAWKQAKVTKEACNQWWTQSAENAFKEGGKIFTKLAGYDPEDVSEQIDDEQVQSYLNSIAGADQGTLALGSTAAVIAAIGGLVGLVVIGGLTLGSIAAMLLALFYLLGAAFALLRGLVSRNMWEPLTTSLKAMFGALLFGACLAIILAVVSLLSLLLVMVGNTIGGAGSPAALSWAAVSPIIVVVGLHLTFKKFRLPSPVTIGGGRAWAQTLTKNGAAAMGGAVGGGLLSRAGHRVRRGAGHAAGNAARRAVGRGPGRSLNGAGGTSGGGNARRAVGRGSADARGRAADIRRTQERQAKAAWRQRRDEQRRKGPLGRAATAIGNAAHGAKPARLGRLATARAQPKLRMTAAAVRRTRLGTAMVTGAERSEAATRAVRGLATRRTRRTVFNAALVTAGVASGPIGAVAATTTVGVRMVREHRRNAAVKRDFIAQHIDDADRNRSRGSTPPPASGAAAPPVRRYPTRRPVQRNQPVTLTPGRRGVPVSSQQPPTVGKRVR